jgi:uroporphyrin-III C-methyltransferase/precorrin-2 dehydrogenase/sirohydrochlorin ferrochelatase
MRYLPLFLDLRARRVVVVGGGVIASRKVDLVIAAGPRVAVVAPALAAGLAARRERGEIAHVEAAFEPAHLDGAAFAIAATDDGAVNAAVADAARERGIPVNVVDDLELSDAILPAIVDRSPLVIAISTAGTAPVLARFLRERIEAVVDDSIGRLAAFLAGWRARIKAAAADVRERRRLYDWILRGPVAQRLRARDEHGAAALLERRLREGDAAGGGGRVTLVGAGPGDPGLLTINALRALQAADVVLHDRLVSAEVLALARREAELIEVGKSAKGHSVAQGRIHELMAEHAARGLHVVRLKGGDPFVFGRGGEELQFLRARGIPYEVVPGVTAALACAAYAGIPLTHREHARSVRLVTAHCRESVDAVDWRGLARGDETLAVYMGAGTLPGLVAELTRHGRAPSTPAAIVENGTRQDQRVLLGDLATLPALAEAEKVASPALIIVGEVAGHAAALHWFGAGPVSVPTAAVSTASRRAA